LARSAARSRTVRGSARSACTAGGSGPRSAASSAAVGLPASCAAPLRRAGVVGRVEAGRVLLDLRSVPAELSPAGLAARVRAALGERG